MIEQRKKKERIGLVAICLGIAFVLVVMPIMQYVFAEHGGALRLPPEKRWDPDLKAEHYHGPPPFTCSEEVLETLGAVGQNNNNTLHLAKYTDAANNTIDVYCKWMDFLDDGTGITQYIAFYNNNTIIGQCPFDKAFNYYNIMADENNIINQTIWISTTPDMSQSVIFNMTFNDYNQTAMAHRPGINYDFIPSDFFWDVYS